MTEMTEDFEETTSASFDLPYYWGMIGRRYLQFVVAFFAGWLAVWGSSWLLPPHYKSGTLILVEQPTMPKDYVTPNISDDLQARLQSITQQILSRTRLLHIIDELSLYSGVHGPITADDKVERMRKDIAIELVRDVQNKITAFNIFYSARDPHVAQRVTRELTNLFINENLEARQQQSEDTTKFLEGQLANARQNLAEQEMAIRQFRMQHVGELPTQLTTNLQILGGLQSQLQIEEDALNSAKQQHVYLETLQNQYRTLLSAHGGQTGTQMGLPAVEQELDRLKSELADISARYTQDHPDVRKLKDQIANTEKIREQIVADIKTQSKSQAHGSLDKLQEDVDLNQSSPMAQIQSQLQANHIEIKNREEAVEGLRKKVNDYQARLNQEPIREQQLADLTRGYDQSKATYDELLKKKNESAMATSMELLQQGERFRILDPPSLPVKPDFPNRLMFCGLGLGAGLLVGIAVIALLEALDDRLYSERELKELLPASLIFEIPMISSTYDAQVARRRMFMQWVATAIVVATIMIGSAVSYLRG
ncbi:MAG: hypothetical protein JO356_06135 [Acidobacteria bacterium]|nr:hypothetical protein [Acidobacteriota bacterium]